jgi:hypothetical protein
MRTSTTICVFAFISLVNLIWPSYACNRLVDPLCETVEQTDHHVHSIESGARRDSGDAIRKAPHAALHPAVEAAHPPHPVAAAHPAGHPAAGAASDPGATIKAVGHDTGQAIEKAGPDVTNDAAKGRGNADRRLVPVREYLRGADIPPAQFGAYGVMAFRAKPTSVARDRLKMACASFVAYLERQSDVPKSVPVNDQMLTIWPLDSPDAEQAKKDDCDFVLDHYDLYGADAAISDAQKQGARFGERGPFLIGWSPSNSRGQPDKLVLVVDMSSYDSQDSFNEALQFWKKKIVEDPSLWRHGFSLERFRLSLRDFVDHYGGSILASLSKK